MNKLGFYIQSNQGVADWISRIQPPVILLHAWDQGLLEEIRGFRSPNSFVVGRMEYFRSGGQQIPTVNLADSWLRDPNPEEKGRAFAQHILDDNFQLARRRVNGRLLVDAWMSLNEVVPGPASQSFLDPVSRPDVERRLRAFDDFQAGFRDKLMEQGVEAAAFNFGAGNFTEAAHYLSYFPRTLESYTYLGFHEYGWPALSPDIDPNAASSAGDALRILQDLRQQTGRDYKAIMTETGLTRMYKDPTNRDEGWLNKVEPLSEDQYWRSLEWYNNLLLPDENVLGACLFEVGHGPGFETFRHIGVTNDGQPIGILSRIEQLRQAPPVTRGLRSASSAPARSRGRPQAGA